MSEPDELELAVGVTAEAHALITFDSEIIMNGPDVAGKQLYSFRPALVDVGALWSPVTHSWGMVEVKVTGARMKADGTVGDQLGARLYPRLDAAPDPHRDMPDWLVVAVDRGMTEIIQQTLPLPSAVGSTPVVNL